MTSDVPRFSPSVRRSWPALVYGCNLDRDRSRLRRALALACFLVVHELFCPGQHVPYPPESSHFIRSAERHPNVVVQRRKMTSDEDIVLAKVFDNLHRGMLDIGDHEIGMRVDRH